VFKKCVCYHESVWEFFGRVPQNFLLPPPPSAWSIRPACSDEFRICDGTAKIIVMALCQNNSKWHSAKILCGGTLQKRNCACTFFGSMQSQFASHFCGRVPSHFCFPHIFFAVPSRIFWSSAITFFWQSCAGRLLGLAESDRRWRWGALPVHPTMHLDLNCNTNECLGCGVARLGTEPHGGTIVAPP